MKGNAFMMQLMHSNLIYELHIVIMQFMYCTGMASRAEYRYDRPKCPRGQEEEEWGPEKSDNEGRGSENRLDIVPRS